MGTSLAVQWLRLCACPAGAQVQPLVRELRSRMPHIAANKKKFFYGLYFSFSPKKSLLIQGYKDLMLFSFKSSLFKFFFLQIICTFFLFFFKFIYYLLFIFGCVGSSFLCEGFLQLRQAGATLHRDAQASHCRGLSRCGAQAPDAQAQ